ncbi:MAG: N-acetylmuramoyl-L-alanine amidase [Armatimonadetes bacterium]|nr:N-acetylmuramoyl-L-alanine amidase [Armatimonadota bacterium]
MRMTTLLVSLLLCATCCLPLSATLSGAKICIDPGHGGSDPGAVGNGLRESDINLDIGLRTRDMFQLDAATVVMTRTTDTYVSLQGRCDIANNFGAHRFLCTHCNSFSDPSANGTETFCHPDDSSTAYDLRNRTNAELVSHMGTYNRGNKTATFYVLSYTNMAAILAEVAFISNPTDASKLGNPAYRHEAARAYLHAMQAHYGQPVYDVGGVALDSSYNNQSYQATMMAGSTAIVWVEYKNTGTETWYTGGSNPVRLGTWNPQDRSSPFYTAGNWIGPNRPTSLDQSSVGPNGIGRFSFIMTAPQTPGVYTEYWRLVKEGTAWFGYGGVYFQITVTPAKGTITGTVRNAANGQVISGADVSVSGGASTTTNSSGVYTFSNLDAATYTLTVSKAGFASASGTAAVTAGQTTTKDFSLTPTDTTAPTNPSGLTAVGASPSQINLSWSASTDTGGSGLAGYIVYRNSAEVGRTSSTIYQDNGLTQNTSYSYFVKAYDVAGNVSGASNTATGGTHPSTVPIFQDGFGSIDGNLWQAIVQSPMTSPNPPVWDGGVNHGTFAGSGSIRTVDSGISTLGCLLGHTFTPAFAAAKFESWFYDPASYDSSRQGLQVRCLDGSGAVKAIYYLGTYSVAPGSFSTYSGGYYKVCGAGCTGWYWPGAAARARAVGWHKLTIDVQPYTGSGNEVAFYIDDSLVCTAERTIDTQTFGMSMVAYGFHYRVNQTAWFDDCAMYATAPTPPTMGAPVALSTSSIRWTLTDTSNREMGFRLLDAGQTVKGTANVQNGTGTVFSLDESGLAPNTAYTRYAKAYNGTLNSLSSAAATRWTLSVPPSSSNVACNRSVSTWYGTPDFAFAAVGGFGDGRVDSYRYAWNQSGTHSFTGSESVWSSGDLPLAATSGGSWYLHLQGLNADGVPNGTADLGPYQYDITPPTAPVVLDEGKYSASKTRLGASWWGADDSESGITKYWYAIGTNPGATDVLGWTQAASQSAEENGLSLSVGQTYYFSVKAENGLGLQGAIGMSDGIQVVQAVANIAEAKGFPDGTLLAILTGVAAADFSGEFYIEESDRSSGMRVEGVGPGEGYALTVAGTMATVGGERTMQDASIYSGGAAGVPASILLGNRYLGGGSLNTYTPGLAGAQGPNNVGLLVSTAGRVTHSEPGFCYIDDGSNLDDGSGFIGVKVDTTTLASPPAVNQYVRITGVSSVETAGADLIRLLRPRRDSDVVTYQ